MKQNNPPMEQEVRAVYERMIGALLDFRNLEDLEEIVLPDFMGYGSAAHEIFKTREDVQKMARIQADQLEGQNFRYSRKPFAEKEFANGLGCLILEELELYFPGNDHHLYLRLSTVLEKLDGRWVVTHFHGSTPDYNIAEEEAFPEEGLRRKNEELEAKIRERTRELEMEAALERVRNSAMRMQTSEELSSLIKTIFKELRSLDMELTRCLLWIFDPEEQSAMVWMTNSEDPDMADRYLVPYHEHPAYKNYLKAWKAKESKWEYLLEGAVKDQWDDILVYGYFARLPEEIKKAMKAPNAVMLSGSFNTYGVIQTASLQSLSEESHEILRRFSQVFEQTYTRFLDLKKAEAQAREAQIEAALERVRTASMAMQKTEHISDVAVVFLNQLKELKLNFVQAWINVFHLDEGYFDIWFSPLEGVYEEPRHLQLPSTLFEDTSIKSWRSGNAFSFLSLKSKEEVDALVTACDESTGTDYFSHFQEILKLERLEFTDANHKYGTVSKSSLEEATEEEKDILHRFAKVFEQTYTRFLDLQKAEAQAREAQIEAALERVRAISMAMHKSDELVKVATTVYKQLLELGFDSVVSGGFNFPDEENDLTKCWFAETGNQDLLQDFTIPLSGDPVLDERQEYRKKGFSFLEQVLKNDEVKQHMEFVFPAALATEDEKVAGEAMPDPTVFSIQFLNEGYMILISDAPLEPQQKSILVRFASVFNSAYTRFLDLKKAEAQAREAQIEAALEKVRSRTMAMQHSDELPQAANVLFLEIQALGIPAWSCGYNILGEDLKSATCWMSSEGTIQKPFTLRLWGEASFEEMGNFVRGDESFLVQELGEKALKEHYDHMLSFPDLLPIFEALETEGLSLPTYQINHLCKFSHGFLLFITYESVPEAHNIFKRFTAVFDQTYTRFLDLQLKEKQAVKLVQEKQRLERTLSDLQATQQQLVHAEKMASLGELTAGIAHEIQNPLNFVNNFSEVSRELLEEMVDELGKGDIEEVDAIAKDVIQNLDKIVHHGKRADSIVKGMLQHSRSGDGKKEPTDLNALVDEYLRLAYHGLRAKDKSFNASMETDFDPSLPKVDVIPQDIGRVLLNLITNAFHAVSKRREKEQEGYEPKVWAKSHKTTDGVEISVRDNGGGIPENIRDKIFQPFFTTKPTGEGTGLGLSMSYDIVTNGHGGELKLMEVSEKGTTFLIYLPVKTQS